MSKSAFSAQYQSLLEFWRARLGLTDWDISLKVLDELENEDAVAEVALSYEDCWAEIRILSDRARQDGAAPDPEKEVVHELLHIVLYPFDPGEDEPIAHILFEQTINRLAKAMISARRSSSNPDGKVSEKR